MCDNFLTPKTTAPTTSVLMPGNIQRKKGSTSREECCQDDLSPEAQKITPIQSTTGTQRNITPRFLGTRQQNKFRDSCASLQRTNVRRWAVCSKPSRLSPASPHARNVNEGQ